MRPSRRTRITIRMVGRYALGGWLLASVPAAVALAFFGSQFSGPSRAAMDCAQVARNIARGRGFTTNVLIPAALSRCERRAAFPDLANPPLHPAGLALAFALGNPRGQRASDNAAALWTLLWWFLVLGLSWALSARLFGLKPAIITVLALTWNVALLRSALAAEVVPPLAFATTALFFAMYEIGRIPADATRPARAIRRLGPILWGAIAGLCFLAEYTFLAVLLAVACFVLLPRDGDRWRRCLAAVVAFLVVTLPWLVRNERAVGDALASVRWYSVVNGMSDYAGGSFARSARPEPLPALVLSDLGEYLRATLVRLGGLRDGILDSGDVFVVGLFIAAAFVPFGDATLNRVRVALYVAMVGVALAVALAGGGLGLTPFVPLINVIAVGFFLQHLEARRVGVRIRRGRRISSAFMRWVIICAGLALL
ncbi:MAG: ArnT family glycosyltransferase, partial [Armatimonadota bacterium]